MATKKKSVEEPKVELPPVEETKPEVIETPVVETPVVEKDPETIEPVKEEPVIEEKKVEDVVKIFNETGKQVWESPKENLSMEDKILTFLKGKTGDVKMNDFLKSLFGVSVGNEPPKWANQGASKLMKATLDKLVKEKGLHIQNNMHQRLGQFYYPDSTTGKTEYHNLNTVAIICVM